MPSPIMKTGTHLKDDYRRDRSWVICWSSFWVLLLILVNIINNDIMGRWTWVPSSDTLLRLHCLSCWFWQSVPSGWTRPSSWSACSLTPGLSINFHTCSSKVLSIATGCSNYSGGCPPLYFFPTWKTATRFEQSSIWFQALWSFLWALKHPTDCPSTFPW